MFYSFLVVVGCWKSFDVLLVQALMKNSYGSKSTPQRGPQRVASCFHIYQEACFGRQYFWSISCGSDPSYSLLKL